MEWIDVRTSLPGIGVTALFVVRGKTTHGSISSSDMGWKFYFSDDHMEPAHLSEVTHWMAIPEPPGKQPVESVQSPSYNSSLVLAAQGVLDVYDGKNDLGSVEAIKTLRVALKLALQSNASKFPTLREASEAVFAELKRDGVSKRGEIAMTHDYIHTYFVGKGQHEKNSDNR